MSHTTRVFTALVLALPLAAGCSAARDQRMTRTTPATAEPAATERLTAIPGHPPITASGVVFAYTPETGHLTFQDGRMVQLTNMTTIAGVGDPRALRAGQRVVVDNVLPVGVLTVSPVAGTPIDPAHISGTRMQQRMATVSAIDAGDGIVRLSDGSLVRVRPATKVHMGAAGPALVVTDLQPGDELVIVLVEPPAGASPSALPRQSAAPVPMDAGEIMIFRVQPR